MKSHEADKQRLGRFISDPDYASLIGNMRFDDFCQSRGDKLVKFSQLDLKQKQNDRTRSAYRSFIVREQVEYTINSRTE